MDRPGRRSSRARYHEDYEQFRALLIAARERAGLTQREAAERLGRSQSFVAKSESGERRVDVIELGEFARIYGRPISFFVLRVGKQ